VTLQAGPPTPAAQAGIDRFLRWGLVVTLVVVVSVLIYGTVAVHRERPPIPDRVVDSNGAVLYTKDDIIGGKGVFQRTDLLDFGSLYGLRNLARPWMIRTNARSAAGPYVAEVMP